MLKRILPLFAALILGAPLLVGAPATAVAPAPAEVQAATNHPYGPYNIYRFHTRSVCIVDHLQNPAYAVGDTANAYEPSMNTGWRTPAQGCNDYVSYQRISVHFYSAPDGYCGKHTFDSSFDSTPDNHIYSRSWDSHTIWVNQWYWAGCRDTDHNRTRHLSRAFGWAFGLERHTACWATYTVMTSASCPGQNGAWPGTHDRDGANEKFSFG